MVLPLTMPSVLTDKFQTHYWTMRNWLAGKGGVTDEEGQHAQEELERIHLLYDHTTSMPTWPFNRNTVEKLALTVIVPLIILLIEAFI